ncbi:hypothetical protein [Enterococcus phage vB_Efa_ZAT1]
MIIKEYLLDCTLIKKELKSGIFRGSGKLVEHRNAHNAPYFEFEGTAFYVLMTVSARKFVPELQRKSQNIVLNGRQLYNFIWDDFCDWYIEMSKEILYGENEAAKQTTRSILVYTLDQILRLSPLTITGLTAETLYSKGDFQVTAIEDGKPESSKVDVPAFTTTATAG